MELRSLEDLDFNGKTVFCRLDLNVPIKDGKITDESRLIAALPTIKYLLERANKVCFASHLGRPKGQVVAALSLEPIASRLVELTGYEAVFFADYLNEPYDQLLKQMGKKQFLILENLRFFPGETQNDPDFVDLLLKGIDLYVNDAFGTVHRAHASIVGMPEKLGREKCAAGYLIKKEVDGLSKLEKPSAPYTVVVGGAKVSDKIKVILNLLNHANHLVIGGAMAYSFLKFKGHTVGKSRTEDDKMELVNSILKFAESRKVEIHLPIDHVCAEEFLETSKAQIVDSVEIPTHLMGLDIGPRTQKLYADVIKNSKTVLWNGPMGVFEWDSFNEGTHAIAQAVASCTGYTVVGGGDSVAAINKAKVSDKISHVSTGGGASLEYLEGIVLPGLKVLMK